MGQAATDSPLNELSRRESQIMDVLYRLGEATAIEVRAELPNPPGRSSVRKQLEILRARGLVRHEVVEREYVYRPAIPVTQARRTRMRQMIGGLFGGSTVAAFETLLKTGDKPSPNELAEIERMLREARKDSR